MKLISNRQLKTAFNQFNCRFFARRLCVNIWVQFAPQSRITAVSGEAADGVWLPEDREILIDKIYARSQPMSAIVLLHEMVHVDLFGVYFGQPNDDVHGMIYQAELVRLFKAGAYDGLL